jgi:hypothetical protein
MDSRETLDFARRLQSEVWERFDAEAVPRFYHLKVGKVSEFWHLASIDLDYRVDD